MKKKLFVFALALCLLLTGCAVQSVPEQTTPGAVGKADAFNSPEPMPGFDADNQYLKGFNIRIQRAGNILFGGSGLYLRYYDMASGVSGVLCPNPECTHDTKSCGAYTETTSSVSYYDGKRYWVSIDPQKGYGDYYLWRSDLSGENREKVKRISFNDVILPYQPQWYAIHRGRLYFLSRTYVEGKAAYRVALMYSPLDSSEEFTAVFDDIYEREVDVEIRFVGNAIYCAVIVNQPVIVDQTIVSELSDATVTRYDRETGAAETLFKETSLPEYVFNFWVTEDGTPYLCGNIDNERVTLWKLENGKKIEIISLQGNAPRTIYFVGEVVFVNSWRDGERWAEIFTMSGEKLYEGLMYPNPIPGMEDDPASNCTAEYYGGDEEKIIVYLESKDDYERNYTVLLDIRNGMKATVLWSNE